MPSTPSSPPSSIQHITRFTTIIIVVVAALISMIPLSEVLAQRSLRTSGVTVGTPEEETQQEQPSVSGQQLWPVDEAPSDPALMLVRDALLQAVIDNDQKAVRRFVASNVENGYDGINGVNSFMKSHYKELRSELRRALEQGGSFSEGSFVAPSTSNQFPVDLDDRYDYGVIYGDSVNIRSRADITSEVVDRLSWNIVQILDWEQVADESGKSYQWYRIGTPNGSTGYVNSHYLWSGTQFVFSKSKGVWKLSAWGGSGC